MASADHGPTRASFVASTLSATLELVREGDLEARQLEHFAEIYLRRVPPPVGGGEALGVGVSARWTGIAATRKSSRIEMTPLPPTPPRRGEGRLTG